MEVVFCHHCVLREAAEERCSRSLEPHLEWWAPGNVGMMRCGLAHIDMRLEGRPGEAVARCSRVEMLVAERSNTGREGLLLKHRELERVVLGTHSLGQRRDEGLVRLRQELAEAGWEYEALGEASSCHSADHGLPHVGKHWVNHIQNELGTDLQLGWADTAAAAEAAGHTLPHGSQEEAAGHMRHTWAVAARHPAKRYAQEQKPASERRRG
jgi:hypothetical protein